MALRGFDDYEVTLGDEMRGERACLGKTLEDAERDLCIKAEMLAAIENCDLEAFANPSVLPGYVRSYARYLGLDPDESYRRFCETSGFRSPQAGFGVAQPMTRDGAATRVRAFGEAAAGMGTGLAQSRFANMPRTRRIGAPVSLGGLFSAVALVGIVGGLGYGGYALLQDIQRLGFAPLPKAPAVVAEAPVIVAPDLEDVGTRPDPSAYSGSGALAAIAPPSSLPMPARLRRDGPISAIDPSRAGVFAALDTATDTDPHRPYAVFASVTPVSTDARPGPFRVGDGTSEEPGTGETETMAGIPIEAEAEIERDNAVAAVDSGKVSLVVVEDAWVRIRDASRAVLFEGILKAGESYDLPDRVVGPVIRAGNAGGIFVTLGGVAHGPLGAPGEVVKNMSLRPDDVRAALPATVEVPQDIASELRSASVTAAR